VREKIVKYKPGASISMHLILAATLWTVIGFALLVRGVMLLSLDGALVFGLLPAILLGWLKSHFILDVTALKNIGRILLLGDGTCLGAVFSKEAWALVLLMMILGIIARNSALPGYITGMICVAIGFSLVFSSRHAWLAWKKNR